MAFLYDPNVSFSVSQGYQNNNYQGNNGNYKKRNNWQHSKITGKTRSVLENAQRNKENQKINNTPDANKIITAQINYAKSSEELISTINKNFQLINDINVAAFWNRLVKKVDVKFSDLRLEKIINYTYELLPGLGSRHVANIIWAFAKLGCKNDDYYLNDFKVAIRKYLDVNNGLKPQEIASVAYAFATIGHNDAEFTQELIDYIKQCLINNPNFFNGQEFANIMFAFTKLVHGDQQFTKNIADRIRQNLINHPDYFKNEELSSIACNLAKLKNVDPELMQALKGRIEQKITDQNNPNFFNAQQLANITWALAELECDDQRFLQIITGHIQFKLNDPNFFNAKDLSTIARSFARLGYLDQNSINLLKARIAPKIVDDPKFFNPQHLADIAWAFAKAGYKDPIFTDALLNRIKSKLKYFPDFFTSQNITDIVLAFSKLDHHDHRFTKALMKQVDSKLRDPDFFNGQELATIALASSNLDYNNEMHNIDLTRYINSKLNIPNFFTTQDLINITLAHITMNSETKRIDFVHKLIQEIDNKFVNGEVFTKAQLNQLLQIKEILPVEFPNIDIPWCQELNVEIDKFKSSLTPPILSDIRNDVTLYLKWVLDKEGTQYNLITNRYELGFYLNNAVLLEGKKIAVQVCDEYNYYVNQSEMLLPIIENKIRILKKNGITTIAVPGSTWKLLSENEKETFLITQLKNALSLRLAETTPKQDVDSVCADLGKMTVASNQTNANHVEVVDEIKE